MLPRKPLNNLTAQEQQALLSGAKGGTEVPLQEEPKEVPKRETKPAPVAKTNKELNIENLLKKKSKTLPIDIPPELHELATECAAGQKKPLYEYILIALAEKVMRDKPKLGDK